MISTFPTFREVLDDILPLNEEYRLITHELEADKAIVPHFHNSAHEWVIVDAGGEFTVFYGRQQKNLSLVKGAVTVIHFTPTIIYGL